MLCTSVPSSNIIVVCMSGVNTDPVHGSECGNTELVATPREVNPSREYVEDSAYTMDTFNNKRGGNGLDVSHSSQQPMAREGVNDVGAFNIQTAQ